MKKTIASYFLGFLTAAILANGAIYAANTTTLYDVITDGVKIVLDGHELYPTDVNGNKVDPIICNGTTYLPVRAVTTALGKAVYWDGPNYTVYLGDMDGKLEYPTEELDANDSIADKWENSDNRKDNYDNYYSRAIRSPNYSIHTFEKICNMKFSRFKGTLYVSNGSSYENDVQIIFKADGKTIYTSPVLNKTTPPVNFDVDITGCNVFQIIQTYGSHNINIGDAGFYQ